MIISVVINADTRKGYLNDKSTVGDFGGGSLQGVRSSDFLIDGLINKMNFFRDYGCQCIMYIDEHEPISDKLFMEIADIVHSYGNNSKLICKPHNRTIDRWNDKIYIEALKLADGDYVAHFDQDSNALITDDSPIIEKYFQWLDRGYDYVCQCWDGIGEPMYHASTRFFICKKETLDSHLPIAENNLITPFRGVHTPCIEHIFGVLAGKERVLYPPRRDNEYLIFSWARYFKGTLKRLNEMKPKDAIDYILSLGVHGVNDVLDKQLIEQ